VIAYDNRTWQTKIMLKTSDDADTSTTVYTPTIQSSGRLSLIRALQPEGGYVRARGLNPLKTNVNTPKPQGLFRFCFDRTNREVLLFPEPVADLLGSRQG